jgi:hypothetical protein
VTKLTRRTSAVLAVLVVALCATAAAYACPGGKHGDAKEAFKLNHGHHHAFKHDKNKDVDFKHGHHKAFVFKTDLVSPDSGTCGNNWASDTLKRTYKVTQNHDGSFTLVAFDRGTFTTVAGQSPGACETTDTHHGATVTAGITGGVVGFVVEKLTGTFNASATCAAVCNRDAFVAAHFGTPTSRVVEKFAFFYGSKDPGLTKHMWVNSGTSTTSNNRGDIATA